MILRNIGIRRWSLIVAGGLCLAIGWAGPTHGQTLTELQAEKSLVWKMLHSGDFARARTILESLTSTARDSKENGLGAKSTFYLECLSLLGATELRMGMLPEATAHLTEAKDGYARRRKGFKDDYRQAVARGQLAAFGAYASNINSFFCRDLDWLGEVMLEQKSFAEAEAFFDESLKAREAAVFEGLVPNEPVASGLMTSKHLKGLLELRRGDLVHARHYLEIARKEYDAFQAAQQMAEESDDGDEPADEPATEPATKPETAEVDSVEEAITALDQTLTHVGLLTHLGELELAEGNAAKAAVLGKQAVDVGTAMLGAKHGVVLEPTILFVRANAALAERRLSENDPRGARTALQAALLGYSAVEPMVESFWVPTSARRTEAKELVSGIRTKLAAAEAAVATLDEAEKAADVAMKKAEDDGAPKKTVTKRRVIRRVVPKATDGNQAPADPASPQTAPKAEAPAAAN